jgi:hypothetical protein
MKREKPATRYEGEKKDAQSNRPPRYGERQTTRITTSNMVLSSSSAVFNGKEQSSRMPKTRHGV